jgi:hypothetical protein
LVRRFSALEQLDSLRERGCLEARGREPQRDEREPERGCAPIDAAGRTQERARCGQPRRRAQERPRDPERRQQEVRRRETAGQAAERREAQHAAARGTRVRVLDARQHLDGERRGAAEEEGGRQEQQQRGREAAPDEQLGRAIEAELRRHEELAHRARERRQRGGEHR